MNKVKKIFLMSLATFNLFSGPFLSKPQKAAHDTEVAPAVSYPVEEAASLAPAVVEAAEQIMPVVSIFNIQDWFDASRNGDLEKIQRFIKEGFDVNAQDEYGGSALELAAFYHKDKIVDELLKSNVNVNVKNKLGDTVLSLLSWYGDKDLISKLIEAHADLNVQNNQGNTPLIMASKGGKHEVIKLLLEAGANPDITNIRGRDLFSEAGYMRTVDFLSTIMPGRIKAIPRFDMGDAGPAPTVTQRPSESQITIEDEFINAVKRRDLNQVQFLIEAGINVDVADKFGNTALIFAASLNYPEVAGLLLKSGADKSITNKAGCDALSATRNSEIKAMLGEPSDEAGPAPVLSISKRSKSDMGEAEQIDPLRFYNAVKSELVPALIKHYTAEKSAVKRQILRLRETNSKLTTSDILQLPYPAEGNEGGTLKTYLEQLAVRNGLEYDALEGEIDNLFY